MTQSPVKVKICGLTSVEAARAAALAGADWIGLNFQPISPRSISIELGAEIVCALTEQGLAHPVGLFVDRPVVEVVEMARAIGIGTIQLHGDESPEYLRELTDAWTAPELPRLVRAFRLADLGSVERMVAYLDHADKLGCPPHAILVDAYVPGQAGGTGRSIAMDLLDRLPTHPRLILAGGLTPGNVAELIARVHPWMVDVASGVESSPGVKDPAKVTAFVGATREIP